ncbi:endopeptidase La [bacterium]|nr:endopeptidase La [bacterium]
MADHGSQKGQGSANVPSHMPLLPVRDIVVYPYMILPLFVGRDKSIKAVEESMASYDRKIFLTAQKDSQVEEPSPGDIYNFGTIANIIKLLRLPDGRIKILVHGIMRGELQKFKEYDPYFLVKVRQVHESDMSEHTLEVEALMRNVKAQLERSVSLGKALLPDVVVIAMNIEDPGKLADLIVSNLSLKIEESQRVLQTINAIERLKLVSEFLAKELELLAMQKKIQSQAKDEMDKDHREYFLRQQLKAIQQELGQTDQKTAEIEEMKQKILKAQMPKEVEKEATKQLLRLERMHPEAAEAGMVRNYLEWLIDLPWSKQTEDNLDIQQASKVLDEDHYDLEKVKERILEYLSVRKLKDRMKGPILCFVGPPGVGKTSLGKSIARALGRKFVRISLGGVRDEAEIRGHRRTYIGSLPGRIIQGIKQAGTNNPVFMMDEVDKVGSDFRGDPSAALLEVLDPEQNYAFSDHYLEVPFDLSNVMFITTANLLDPILPAFRDRMEIIHLSGYTEMEKLKIAERYLIPKQLEENGITSSHLVFHSKAILGIITEYTRESGVRNLEREIASVCRKRARKLAEGDGGLVHVTTRNLQRYLGISKFKNSDEYNDDTVGLAIGLAWTESGGDIIHVEASTMKGKGNLTLTGHLGEIMKESAQTALSFARSKCEAWGVKESAYMDRDIHIHVPAGAIPKDGPSAGITMATAIVSVLSDTPVRKNIAMTGEITLRGRVLHVGGLKSKVLAAKRAGINTIIVPEKNKNDIEDLPPEVRSKITFAYVRHIDEVLELALKRDSAKEAIKPKLINP